MTNQNKKLAKVLAATIFGVGFVTPLMFSNIAEAANFGAGGTTQWLSDAQLAHTYISDTSNSSGEYSKWAKDRTYTGSDYSGNLTNDNCVIFHGVKFKIVAVDDASKGQNAKVTLWSYETDGTKFYNTKTAAAGVTTDGKIKYNSSSSGWGSNVNKAYANSYLKTAMDNLYSTTFASDSRIQAVTLAGETISSTSIAYQEKDTTDTIKSYVWAPSKTEVESIAWGDGTNALTNGQRAIGNNSWLRSPYPDYDSNAYNVDFSGYVLDGNA